MAGARLGGFRRRGRASGGEAGGRDARLEEAGGGDARLEEADGGDARLEEAGGGGARMEERPAVSMVGRAACVACEGRSAFPLSRP
jgi:hypothetical protein